MTEILSLIQKFESWPEPVKPPFPDIKKIGCCSEHKDDFKWFRTHTWENLRDLLLANAILEEHGLPFPLSSLDHPVHRYYTKGVLSALARTASQAASFEELNWRAWEWIAKAEDDLDIFRNKTESRLLSPMKGYRDVAHI